MKKFLLIIAVATAGFIPQLALCDARGLVDSAKALAFYQIKQTYPGLDPVEVNPALANDQVAGPAGHKDGDCPYARNKTVPTDADKIYGSEAAGQAGSNTANKAGDS